MYKTTDIAVAVAVLTPLALADEKALNALEQWAQWRGSLGAGGDQRGMISSDFSREGFSL